jgi:general secretion pathway protein L
LKLPNRANSPLLRLLGLFNIAAFLRWWRRGLLLWLPVSIRNWFIPTPEKLIFEVQDEGLVIRQEKGKTNREIDRYSIQSLKDGSLKGQLPKTKDKRIVLRLPAENALVKTISLPMAAETNLRQVVGFEIDRLTPFSPNKVYFDAQVISRRMETRNVQVRFVMILRTLVDGFLQQLTALKLAPDAVDIVGSVDDINLLPPEHRPRKGQGARGIQGFLWVLILFSLIATSILPLWQQRNNVLVLMPKVEAAQQQAETAVALRTELESTVTSSQFLLQKRLHNELVIELVNELSTILPDNTWVEQLVINGDEIQVRGQSLAAATLISLVEASDKFESTTFRSPVVQDRRTGRDRFFLSSQISKKIMERGDS